MSQVSVDSGSDDEVFIGPITLKEIRKRFPLRNHRQTVGCVNMPMDENSDMSIKIIETHSAPNIMTPIITVVQPNCGKATSSPDLSSPNLNSSPDPDTKWDIKSEDDSFLMLEQLVSTLPYTPRKEDIKQQRSITELNKQNNIFKNNAPSNGSIFSDIQEDVFGTPSAKLQQNPPIFKTPLNPVSHKKLYFTPSKRFQHVVSPVATYINKSPIVPLVKDVCPKKPLPGASSIPKLVKHVPRVNKENEINCQAEKQTKIKLPSVAYRPAKETKLIDIPDDNRLPLNHWAKQVASSIPKAMIIKHNHREVQSSKKVPLTKPEDSFADLSLHQADISVCTQKSAFVKK